MSSPDHFILQSQPVAYIAGPDVDAQQARAIATRAHCGEPLLLTRRGATLGWIAPRQAAELPAAQQLRAAWQASQPILLPGCVHDQLATHERHIRHSLRLMEAVLTGEELTELLEKPPYAKRFGNRFEILASSEDEGDPQEIETLEFDVLDHGEIIAENLWCKASWLSFEDDDDSLRFRFSFGMANYEDVAADVERELHAAALAEAVFPESTIITQAPALETLLKAALEVPALAYVERIVYFNAPNGGAQFHQDVERGHLGVVFAQVHGRTGWLSLPKQSLLDEIQSFVTDANCVPLETLLPESESRLQLLKTCANRSALSDWLDETDNEPLELLLNRCPEFAQQLIEHGHAFILQPGDVIMLPQHDLQQCAWHTVFCLDDYTGEALSFAVRTV